MTEGNDIIAAHKRLNKEENKMIVFVLTKNSEIRFCKADNFEDGLHKLGGRAVKAGSISDSLFGSCIEKGMVICIYLSHIGTYKHSKK